MITLTQPTVVQEVVLIISSLKIVAEQRIARSQSKFIPIVIMLVKLHV